MITTTYKCDKCGKVQETPDQMWEVALSVNHLNYSAGWLEKKMQAHWCRECTERAGINPPRVVKQEEIRPATLEDFIRDIVRQEIGQAAAN